MISTATRNLSIVAAAILTCGGPALAAWPETTSGDFVADWQVSGSVHLLERPDGVQVGAGSLKGTLVIQASGGQIPSFETDCVWYADNRSQAVGHCIWTETSGDQIFVDLSSNGPAGFGRARGTVAGGTGRFEKLSGQFQFEWNYTVKEGKDATLEGHTVRMMGSYRAERP